MIEKLDSFLSSIEHRLEKFEQYFQVIGDGSLEDDEIHNEKAPGSRRGSSASLSSIKLYSAYNLNKVHEQLILVKDQVLKTSFTNLDFLYKTLDDKYNYLFNSNGEPHSLVESLIQAQTLTLIQSQSQTLLPTLLPTLTLTLSPTLPMPDSGISREILTTNIINTIQFFEQKLNHIDQLIKSKTPLATANYDKDAKFNRFRFFNFNKALKDAELGHLHYYQLPLSWRENRYIIHGYRFTMHHSDMLRSAFRFNHNESGNIWTHMFGALAVLYLGIWHFPNTEIFSKNTVVGNLIVYLFLLAALECFVCSVLWHTYLGFAQLPIRSRFACIDYTGITVLITCSVISVEYCALANYPKLLFLYVGFSVLSGFGLLFFNWSAYFDRPECRPLRIGFFVSLALMGGTTFLYKAYYEGVKLAVYFFAPIAYNSLLWYWVGVIFYGGLIPERWRYDVIINEDDTCKHTHTSADILLGHIENSGQKEFEELEQELDEKDMCDGVESATHAATSEGEFSADAETDADNERYQEILAKHFPPEPVKTPYHRDFMSLWWVDYVCNSHNIWHVFVVLGALGHYVTLLGMFEKVAH